MQKLIRALVLIVLTISIGGCGLNVPYQSEIFDQSEGLMEAGGALEKNVKSQIYCELKHAVAAVTTPGNPYYLAQFRKGLYDASLPDYWGIEFTLTLQVTENSSLNPSLALSGFPPQTGFTLGLSGTASSSATRTDKFTSLYIVKDLRTDLGKTDECFYDQKTFERRNYVAPGSSLLIRSDLRILDWLYGALHVEDTYKSQADDPRTKDDIYSYDVKFAIVTSGTANPAWKLLRVATNQSGSAALLGAGRTRTHELLMTFGPTQKDPKSGRTSLSTAASNSHLASEIGAAVSNNLRGLVIPGLIPGNDR
ncbi:hypothetical protein [Bradyrhizobium sp. RT10b]|uniref:hypothetical protein n=1 Tax=Bradyrhizobium sp. RT10b TaxID=3156331 RepID=UPI003391E4EE